MLFSRTVSESLYRKQTSKRAHHTTNDYMLTTLNPPDHYRFSFGAIALFIFLFFAQFPLLLPLL